MSARIISFDEASDVRSIAVRVHPLDVGFDLRGERLLVEVPEGTTRASFADRHGHRLVVEGETPDVAATLRAAGYKVRIGGK